MGVDDKRNESAALRALLGMPASNASINVSADGGVAILVAAIGAFALVVAVAAVIVVAIWRDADVRDMAQIRSRLTVLEAHNAVQERRINELESGERNGSR